MRLLFFNAFNKANSIISGTYLPVKQLSLLTKKSANLLYLCLLNGDKNLPFIALTSFIRQLLVLFIIVLNPINSYAISITDEKSASEIRSNTKTLSSHTAQALLPILPKTVTIPSGCYQMGSHLFDSNRNKNETLHRVCIKRFQMAVHEVTVAEFKSFIKATNYITDAEIDFQAPGCWSYDASQKTIWGWQPWANWKKPIKITLNDNDPVTCVNFYDIVQYINWLNKTTGYTYRLPTEAEWEYAARAGSSNIYFWGNNPDLSCRYANTADLSEFATMKWSESNHCNDHFFFSAPVKQYLPNQFGLYDMLGNVWEWTCSQYQKAYQGQELQCIQNESKYPVFIAVRGGGWNAGPNRTRLAYRNWAKPWIRIASWGFRLVKASNDALTSKNKSRKSMNLLPL